MLQNYIVADLETTGLDPKIDKIIEIGALKIQNREIVGSFSKLVNPGRKLEERIVEITGICDEDLREAPYIEEVLPEFFSFAEENVLVGHSILFDYSFLKKAAVNQKFDFERQGVDTLRISRRHLPHLESRSLPYLCKYYGIPHQPHRALSDVEATYALYQRLEKEFYKEEMDMAEKKLFEPFPLIYKVKREQPATARQKEHLKKILFYHNIQSDKNIDRMTRNEISRYTDQLLSQFGRIPKGNE